MLYMWFHPPVLGEPGSPSIVVLCGCACVWFQPGKLDGIENIVFL